MTGLLCAFAGLGAGSVAGTSDSGGIATNVSSMAMTAISDELQFRIGSGGEADLTASYTYSPGSMSVYLVTRWYRLIGGVWTAVGTEINATTGAYWDIYYDGSGYPVGGGPVDGYGACNLTLSGLSPGAEERFMLYARTYADGQSTMALTGSVAGEGN